MSGFQLDTSGTVWRSPQSAMGATQWSDLSPFAQGYVEALFAGAAIEFPAPGVWMDDGQGTAREVGFSDLSPEALALILQDCEAFQASGVRYHYSDSQAGGRGFFDDRQRGVFEGFPPLTPYLSDDGKIHLREST